MFLSRMAWSMRKSKSDASPDSQNTTLLQPLDSRWLENFGKENDDDDEEEEAKTADERG